MLPDLSSLFVGAALNLVAALVIVRGIYFPATRSKGFVLSFLCFSTVIYLVLRFMTSLDLGLGFGFGLFAIFSVLRYRTDEVPIREMTYLFSIIGLAVLNSFVVSFGDLLPALLANAAVALVLFTIERGWGFQFDVSLPLIYERMDLIDQNKRELLLTDLRLRTGLPIERAEVRSVDFLRDTAELRVYYRERGRSKNHWPNDVPESPRAAAYSDSASVGAMAPNR